MNTVYVNQMARKVSVENSLVVTATTNVFGYDVEHGPEPQYDVEFINNAHQEVEYTIRLSAADMDEVLRALTEALEQAEKDAKEYAIE